MKLRGKEEPKVKLSQPLPIRKKWEEWKSKKSAPEANSLPAVSAAILSYAAPLGAALTKVYLPELAEPQALLLFATPFAVYLEKTWSKRRETEAKDRESEAKKRRIQQDDFWNEYIAHISDVVANRVGEDFKNYLDTVGEAVALRGSASSYTREEARKAQKLTLRNICAAVAIYYKEGDDERKQKFNASLMLPEDYELWLTAPGGKFKEAVRFFDPRRDVDACTKMLHLTCWAREPQGWKPFVLAVDGDADYVLPGAPRAYATRKLQVVADTKAVDVMEKEMIEHAKIAKRQLRNYFEENEDRFRSFFSVPLILNERIVGILNVQSKETHILGANNEHQKDLELSLLPFCALLVSLITREESVQSQDEESVQSQNTDG